MCDLIYDDDGRFIGRICDPDDYEKHPALRKPECDEYTETAPWHRVYDRFTDERPDEPEPNQLARDFELPPISGGAPAHPYYTWETYLTHQERTAAPALPARRSPDNSELTLAPMPARRGDGR
jgi:hypothetical protein